MVAPPFVSGFTINGQLSSDATGTTWAAVRAVDEQELALRIVPVPDVTEARAQAIRTMARLDGIENQHLLRQHDAIAVNEGALALVLDQVTGGSLAQLLGDRGHLTPGETVTTVAPLFAALADLHAAGVVHGDLAPRSVQFSVDGRPLISDLGLRQLLRRGEAPVEPADGYVAPEVVGGAAPSSASDVYSMAALGWLCLSGAPPTPALDRPPLSTPTLRARARLLDVLASCLSADPTARPSARVAAVEVFDAALAESVILTSMADPANEITRRIRASAASVPVLGSGSTKRSLRSRSLVIGAVALLVSAAAGAGAIWFLGRTPDTVHPVAVPVGALHPAAGGSTSSGPTAAVTALPFTTPEGPATDVVTASDSPRVAATGLLQALVDARALAYAARNPPLLDLVYAPGATKAAADRTNLATALAKGATYVGLAFVVTEASFLDGTSTRARIRATILTPAYETGQPDGRKVSHAQASTGPSVFTLTLTQDGWRILALTAP